MFEILKEWVFSKGLHATQSVSLRLVTLLNLLADWCLPHVWSKPQVNTELQVWPVAVTTAITASQWFQLWTS